MDLRMNSHVWQMFMASARSIVSRGESGIIHSDTSFRKQYAKKAKTLRASQN